MQETERAIRTALQAAQKMAEVRVDHVIACFSGANPRSYGLDAQVDLEGQVVTEAEVARVLAACDVPNYGEGREVLHAQPVNFALDNRSGLSDPRGQLGQNLAVDMHMLTVDASTVQNLAHCIKRCDLELAGIASSAYAAGHFGAGRGRTGTGRCLYRHGRRIDQRIDLHEETHDLCRQRAHGRRSRHRRYFDGAGRER